MEETLNALNSAINIEILDTPCTGRITNQGQTFDNLRNNKFFYG